MKLGIGVFSLQSLTPSTSAPDGVASGIAAIAPNIDRKQIAALTSTVTKSLQSGAASVVSKLQ